MRYAEKEKNKNLVPNSVHTQHEEENYEKSSKKFQKTIKPLPGNIFRQNGMRYTEKEIKILAPNSVHTRPG